MAAITTERHPLAVALVHVARRPRHRHVPDGWMPAARYFLEELGVDVNVRDAEGFTALHHTAARGDNETIQYFVSRGADVMAVNRAGADDGGHGEQSRAADAALSGDDRAARGMGAKSNHNCRACK
jgi:ankyrin repeat protein